MTADLKRLRVRLQYVPVTSATSAADVHCKQMLHNDLKKRSLNHCIRPIEYRIIPIPPETPKIGLAIHELGE